MIKKRNFIIIILMLFSLMVFCQRKSIEKGIASYYHDNLKGYKTANGERYNPKEMTAAHLTLPFGSEVKVVNLKNNKSVVVRINDRGPFIEKRIIDLSRAAADSLDFTFNGLAKVEINVIRFGKQNESPSQQLIANSNTKTINKTTKSPNDSFNSTKQNIIANYTPFNNENNNSNIETLNKIATINYSNPLWASQELYNIQPEKEKTPIATTTLIPPLLNDSSSLVWAFQPNYNINKIKDESTHKIPKVNTPDNNTYISLRTLNPFEIDYLNNNIQQIHKNNNQIKENVIVKESENKHSIKAKSIPPSIHKIQNDTNQNNVSGMVYGVQIGSFKLKSNMLNLSEKLKKNYIDKINIQEVNKDKVHYYRFILGEYSNIADAEKLKRKLIKVYPKCFIISF